MKLKEQNTHKHKAVKMREVAFCGGAAPGARENRAAHGWVTIIETCACGAQRRTNKNGLHIERGKWV